MARRQRRIDPLPEGSRALYVVMGVAGSGKSVIGAALARALGVDFVEGDDYHSTQNVKRMSSGVPLTDEDRASWLSALAARICKARKAGKGLVVSCSALKRSYRDILRAEAGELQFIYLRGPRAVIVERIAQRHGHFMPPALLDSQFDALQVPSPEEQAWVIDIAKSPDEIIAALMGLASA